MRLILVRKLSASCVACSAVEPAGLATVSQASVGRCGAEAFDCTLGGDAASCEAAEASAFGGSSRFREVDIRTPVRRGWRHGLRRKDESDRHISGQVYCKHKELCTRRKG